MFNIEENEESGKTQFRTGFNRTCNLDKIQKNLRIDNEYLVYCF